MFELVKKLRDLKDLIPPAYYGTLKDIAVAALAGDWRTVHAVVFDLAEKITADYLFGEASIASEWNEAELDAALAQLEQQTMTAAAAAAIDPGTWVAIIGTVVELIKLIRDRRK